MHGMFAFSEEARKRLAALLRALLITQLLLSLMMLIYCYNTSAAVMLLLKQIHEITVLLVYGLILLQAYGMKLHYTSGLRLVALLIRRPYRRQISCSSAVWLGGGIGLMLNGWLVYIACRGTLKTLLNELSPTLRTGMSQYLTEPKWKRLMDTMQIELNCCGAESPSDWHEIPWINIDFLNEDSELVMKLAGADGKTLPPVTPYSCCTPRVLAPCYHDPLQQTGSAWSGSPLRTASLHARGCAEAVRRPLTATLLAPRYFSVLVSILEVCVHSGRVGMVAIARGIAAGPLTATLLAPRYFSVLVTILEVLIVLLTQLLRTSARDAVLRGDFTGAGRGYLFYPDTAKGRNVVSLQLRLLFYWVL
ncbi:hypothetical protein ACJJTC_003231 [Scirpophaga incertulas]